MSEKIKASISALIDDEVSELEVHQLLRQYGEHSDHERTDLKASWIRYSQIRSVSQGDHQLSTQQHLDLHSRISSVIADEPAFDGSSVLASTAAQAPKAANDAWYKPVTGLAVAASLVMAVYIGLQTNSTDGIGTGFADTEKQTISPQLTSPQLAQSKNQAIQPTLVSTTSAMMPLDTQTTDRDLDMPEELRELSPQAQDKFREYLLRHELMNRRSTSQNYSTVTFDQARPRAPQQGSN